MGNYGLHDKLEIDHREFHIHTGMLLEQRKILTEVFEKGMFLISREYYFDLRSETKQIDYEYLNKITNEFHNSIVQEIEALYHIEAKLTRYRHPRSHYYLGVLFLKRNLFEEAIRQFQQTITQDPEFIKAYAGLGISYLKSKNFDKAIQIFQQALLKSEKYPDILNYSGLVYLFKGDFDRAISLFKEAIQLNPNYYECQFNLGVALYKSALEGVKDAQAVAVPARVSIYLKQVRDSQKYRSLHWQKEFNQLLELLKTNNHSIILPELEEFQLKLVDLVADKEKIYEFYLRFLFGGKELSLETINKYEKYFYDSTLHHQQYPDYWNDLGVFKLIKSRGLYLKAISEFERALQLAPEYKDAALNLEKIKSSEKGFLILLRAILK